LEVDPNPLISPQICGDCKACARLATPARETRAIREMSQTPRRQRACEGLGIKFVLTNIAMIPGPSDRSAGRPRRFRHRAAPHAEDAEMARSTASPAASLYVDCEVSRRSSPQRSAAKSAQMIRPRRRRLTPLSCRGIKPFGQKNRVPVAVEETALRQAKACSSMAGTRIASRTRPQRFRDGDWRDRAGADCLKPAPRASNGHVPAPCMGRDASAPIDEPRIRVCDAGRFIIPARAKRRASPRAHDRAGRECQKLLNRPRAHLPDTGYAPSLSAAWIAALCWRQRLVGPAAWGRTIRR